MIIQTVYSESPLIYKTYSDSNLWITDAAGRRFIEAYDPIPRKYSETEETINVSKSN